MDPIRVGRHRDQLQKRREQVAMTLQHVEKERHEAEQNTDWLDQAAYESRLGLLDRLSEWYLTEMEEIDSALDRMKRHQYGFCLACHTPIEAHRLDCFPEAAFCSACQEAREALAHV